MLRSVCRIVSSRSAIVRSLSRSSLGLWRRTVSSRSATPRCSTWPRRSQRLFALASTRSLALSASTSRTQRPPAFRPRVAARATLRSPARAPAYAAWNSRAKLRERRLRRRALRAAASETDARAPSRSGGGRVASKHPARNRRRVVRLRRQARLAPQKAARAAPQAPRAGFQLPSRRFR